MVEQRHQDERPLRDLTILVVEDQFVIALDIESILREAGADVLGPFGALAPARHAAANESISVAILDFRLDDDTTREIAEILAARDIPFLYYTGQSLPDELAQAPVLSKPASTRSIIDAIAAATAPRP